VLALAISLAGCSPVEAWRSLSGASKNDPDPATAPFTGNLAAADAAPYPNLASVPPPPTRATSTAERQKLAQSLIADRAAAAAQAGSSPAVPVPSPGGPKPAAAPLPQHAAPPPIAATAPSSQPGAAVPAPDKSASAATQTARQRGGAPAEPVPMDSSLQMPQVRSLPEPETARPPPPPPRVASAPAAAVAAEPPPTAAATAAPQAAPAPPVLAPVAPPAAPARAEPRRAPAAMTVATLDQVAPGRIDRGQIYQVAGLYKEQPGTVRVVAYAAAPAPGADPLALYQAALDRAHAVAKALADAGIPASRIQTEATPAAAPRAAASAAASAASGAATRVDIQFLP
jgi:hypothetical protein